MDCPLTENSVRSVQIVSIVKWRDKMKFPIPNLISIIFVVYKRIIACYYFIFFIHLIYIKALEVMQCVLCFAIKYARVFDGKKSIK